MLQSALVDAANDAASSRVFIYEVSGLRPTDNNGYQVRRSGNVFIKVPYDRMNEEMRRISRMGGTIVNIHSSMPSVESDSESAGGEE